MRIWVVVNPKHRANRLCVIPKLVRSALTSMTSGTLARNLFQSAWFRANSEAALARIIGRLPRLPTCEGPFSKSLHKLLGAAVKMECEPTHNHAESDRLEGRCRRGCALGTIWRRAAETAARSAHRFDGMRSRAGARSRLRRRLP